MPYLYEQLDTLRAYGAFAQLPDCIRENLDPDKPLRPYQVAAFENFITYFENDRMRRSPTQVLFHMATGSGKTLIMAGLMLYLYQKGYRDFLFFVNLSNIVKKTRDNFLDPASGKYLFADELRLCGRTVPIRQTRNFQYTDRDAINICFTTTQALHTDMWLTKENAVSLDDFAGRKLVLISDEAHHLNADTRTLERDREERDSYHSWEQTVRRIFACCRDNVLLEFTATCDLHNDRIRAEYEDKIIFDYPLVRFRQDGYSKEIRTLRTDVSVMDRAIQALVLSQYRQKVFASHRLAVKPVVLFKSAKIADSAAFMDAFADAVAALTGDELLRISRLTDNDTLRQAYGYFARSGVSLDQLAQELREDFSPARCISANDERQAEAKQLALNSLEDASNPYRAVFEVKKLDEGWDVLNLFDIVRLYETRQSSGRKISPATVSEAQLIGRGARYFPFQLTDEQERYRRKYDADLDDPMRICEQLYYHCQNDSRYIAELNGALRQIGADPDRTVVRRYALKPSFKAEAFYREGLVFVNDRQARPVYDDGGLPASLRDRTYTVRFATGSSGEDALLDSEPQLSEQSVQTYAFRTTIGAVAQLNYAIVHKALCRYRALRFDVLRARFPALRSARQFIQDSDYLGAVHLEIVSARPEPTPAMLCAACGQVLEQIARSISREEERYEGSRNFRPEYIHDVFTDKLCSYTLDHDGGLGFSQNDPSVPAPWRLDLSGEDWFACEDNYGTSEEKAFVACFRTFVPRLREKYEKVYLIRNERHLHLYAFADGGRFEPDYVLFLLSPREDGYEQLQVFIEPKGDHLLERDAWKEQFLRAIEDAAVAQKTYADGNTFRLRGLRFFNRQQRAREFEEDMESLL